MNEKVQWHPVFATALKLELKDYYPDYIDIQEEYQLTSKPLEVDILIIKKIKDVKILRNIAEIFEEHNIVEYKSPDDYLSIDDYYKVKAYAYLYKTLTKNVDEIKIDKMTITMVSNSFPEKMVEHIIKYQGAIIKSVSDGIYYIEGEDVKSQIIVIDELPKNVNRYIKLLTKKMNIKDEIKGLIKDYAENPKDPRYEMLIDAVTESNIKQLVEVILMSKGLTHEEEKAIEEVIMKLKLDKKWYEKGKIEGKIEGKMEGKIEGKIEEKVNVLSRLLAKKFGNLPEILLQKIQSINDTEVIDKIIDNIFEINSLDELNKYFSY